MHRTNSARSSTPISHSRWGTPERIRGLQKGAHAQSEITIVFTTDHLLFDVYLVIQRFRNTDTIAGGSHADKPWTNVRISTRRLVLVANRVIRVWEFELKRVTLCSFPGRVPRV